MHQQLRDQHFGGSPYAQDLLPASPAALVSQFAALAATGPQDFIAESVAL